ncbi:MAG: TolC family protein [Candidatus Aminicenantes bacterium]|nr:MAG: TolC family protein [Candidatus Aminicenantes bacterium]
MNYRRYISLFTTLLIITCLGFPQTPEKLPVKRIGMVLDGYYELNEQYLSFWLNEILELTRADFDVQFPEDKRIVADWTAKGVEAGMNRLLADPEVDLIIAMGVIASHDVATRGSLPKPVIAPWILDAGLMGFPYKDGTSGVKNLNYVNMPERTIREVQAFLEVIEFRKAAYLFDTSYLKAIPEIRTRGTNLVKKIGIDLQVIGVGKSIDFALAQLSPEIEVVILGPLFQIPRTDSARLIDELIKRKLPSFASFDVNDVDRGIMASVIADVSQQVARRVALNIQRILLGEEPGSIPVDISIGEQLKINMATARAIGVYPAWRVLIKAELLNEELTDLERKLSLNSAVQEAIEMNLELAARERFVSAGAQDVRQARSQLLPQIDLLGTGIVIDKDRAEASFGSQAQRTLSGSVSATQVIYSEPVWANLSIQKSLQKSREWDFEQLRLDITLAASSAYLNVLRAKTFEKIQRDNLKRIRTNLEIARVRETTGMAGPAEVYRWESALATNQKASMEVSTQRMLAEIELNRLLHRPLDEPFITLEVGMGNLALYTSEEVLRLTGNIRSMDVFRKFMVEEGLNASPELEMLNAAIETQERILRSASYSSWLPTLALQGEVSHIFAKGGAGTSSGFGLSQSFPFPEMDNTSWNIGLSLFFPLFKGGEKLVVRTKAQKELDYLNFQKQAITERIEQRILSAIYLTGSSYVGIEQARDAADAANKSLEIVQNAYSQGAVSILSLLDAQTAAFNADQAAANAVYDFLLDLLEMERSTGRFEFFMDNEERQALLERMRAFYKKYGIYEERQ